MKPLADDSNRASSAEACAALVAEVVPLVMRTIRAEMRGHRSPDLSVPQFRTLLFLRRQPGVSVSEVAEHIGLTLPTVSKMIDRLVVRDLVARHSAPEDRRRICLELTPLGAATLQATTDITRKRLAKRLAELPPQAHVAIIEAMHSLQMVFGEAPMMDEPESTSET